ncbi:hypothetical protein ACWCOW_38580 [Streptomyces sp. NPDC001939]
MLSTQMTAFIERLAWRALLSLWGALAQNAMSPGFVRVQPHLMSRAAAAPGLGLNPFQNRLHLLRVHSAMRQLDVCVNRVKRRAQLTD